MNRKDDQVEQERFISINKQLRNERTPNRLMARRIGRAISYF